jgi:hypothetical protein
MGPAQPMSRVAMIDKPSISLASCGTAVQKLTVPLSTVGVVSAEKKEPCSFDRTN